MRRRTITVRPAGPEHIPALPDVDCLRMRWHAIIDRIPEGRPTRGAEIGVLYAHTSARVLRQRPQTVLLLVDPWKAPEPDSDYYLSGDTNATKAAEKHQQAFLLAMQAVGFAGERAVTMRMLSQEAANHVADGSLDYVFIDGDHSYNGVKADIELWLPKVRLGGWIGGHDYDHPLLPGVKQAVDKVFQSVTLDANRTWFRSV